MTPHTRRSSLTMLFSTVRLGFVFLKAADAAAGLRGGVTFCALGAADTDAAFAGALSFMRDFSIVIDSYFNCRVKERLKGELDVDAIYVYDIFNDVLGMQ